MGRLTGLAVAVAAVCGTPAAMARPTQTGREPIRFGAPIPGLCLLARADALAGSKAAQATRKRIDEAKALVAQQAAAENARLQSQLAGDEAKDPTVRADLTNRLNAVGAFERSAQARIEQQSAAAASTTEQDMAAALGVLINRKRCSLIVERSITYGWSNAMDITPDVIAEMDRAATASGTPPR